MAYTDSLFQLGMDLTRSSTAQKEDHGQTALGALDDRKNEIAERESGRLSGTHLLLDLYGARRLDDLKHIKETLKRCVEAAGATLLHVHVHRFAQTGGVSGVAVLSQGHVSVHSSPGSGYVALDVFMGQESDHDAAIEVLKAAFRPTRTVVKQHQRAGIASEPARKAPAREKARAAA